MLRLPSPRPPEPTLLPATQPSIIQYNMATSCVAGQTLPASLPACCAGASPLLPPLASVCTYSQGSLPSRPQLDTYLPNTQITSTAYAMPLQQTKVLPKLHLPYFPLHTRTCSFYYHPVLSLSAGCLPEVQDSHPLPPSTQLIPVHPHSPPGQSSTTTKAPYSRVAILL